MKKKILIVDDDPDICEALQLTFELSGFIAKALPNPEEIYSIAEEYKPDAVVLDVLLSGHDGRKICKSLKDSDNLSTIPVLMISAHPEAAHSTISAGADDFLAKPFNIDQLLHKVNNLLPKTHQESNRQ